MAGKLDHLRRGLTTSHLNAKQSFKGQINARHNLINRFGSSVTRINPNLSTQQKLGLWAKWWTRLDTRHCAHSRVNEANLTVIG